MNKAIFLYFINNHCDIKIMIEDIKLMMRLIFWNYKSQSVSDNQFLDYAKVMIHLLISLEYISHDASDN